MDCEPREDSLSAPMLIVASPWAWQAAYQIRDANQMLGCYVFFNG